MKSLAVIQHTSADYLGLIEDHLEGRGIRFNYYRPFTEGTPLPHVEGMGDGLMLMGGGPWGSAGVRDVPTLAQEIALAEAAFTMEKPVIGIGLGAQILCHATGGGAEPHPLELKVGRARRVKDDALAGFMPESFPIASYMRDRPILPPYAEVLAEDEDGLPVVFQVGPKAFGFIAHPAMKSAIIEDLIMEFEEGPESPGESIAKMPYIRDEIEDSLVPIMAGLIKMTDLMA